MNPQDVLEQAIVGASAVIEQLFNSMAAEAPGRAELRARFEAVLNAPDETTYDMLRAGFERDFPGQFMREDSLKMRREEVGNANKR